LVKSDGLNWFKPQQLEPQWFKPPQLKPVQATTVGTKNGLGHGLNHHGLKHNSWNYKWFKPSQFKLI
jgi:hypothetical protein